MSAVVQVDIAAHGEDDFLLVQSPVDISDALTSRGLSRVTFDGGVGNDILAGGGAGVVRLFGFGDDGDDLLQGGQGEDRFEGGLDNDTLVGGGGADTLEGGVGDDSFVWSVGDGLDTLNGGFDVDLLRVNGTDDRADRFSVRADGGNVVFELNDGPVFQRVSSVEVLDIRGQGGGDILRVGDVSGTVAAIDFGGGAGNDILRGEDANTLLNAVGDEGEDILVGGASDDSLHGDNLTATGALFGDDLLVGGGGRDTLRGGPGADTLDGGTDEDILQGGAGTDTLLGGDSGLFEDVLQGGPGNDTLDGGGGVDFIDVSDATNAVTFTLAQSGTDTVVDLSTVGLGVDTYRNMEGVFGSAFDDTLFGSAGADTLNGALGNDQLFGFRGADQLLGGDGRDTLEGGAGNDRLEGGANGDVFAYRPVFPIGGRPDRRRGRDLRLHGSGRGSKSRSPSSA